MNNKPIKGKYNILSVPAFTSGYTFTGSNRDAEISPDSAFMLSVLTGDYSPDYGLELDVNFIYENLINIKRIRVNSKGAPGLQSSAFCAAQLFINVICGRLGQKKDETPGDVLCTFGVIIPRWNEWVNTSLCIKPFENDVNIDKSQYDLIEGKLPVCFGTLSESEFKIDDYNVQSAYIGESFTPSIEFEIETAGTIIGGGIR